MTEPDRERALVDELVADARPVRRLWSPEARLALWLVLAAVGLAALAAGVTRDDLPLRLQSPSFLLEQVLLLLGGGLLGLEAFRAAVPGRALRSATLVAGWVALGLGLGWMLRAPVHTAWTRDAFLEIGRPCLWRALAWGALPWIGLVVALRRGMPLDRRRAGVLAGIATWALVYPAVRMCCQTDELLHLSVFHAAPVVVAAVASGLLGPVLLARSRTP
jgi:Negative regulator of sigma F